MSAPIVFFDIAGPDADAQKRFYEGVFGWDVHAGGRVATMIPAADGGRLRGVLRTDPAGVVLYLGVEDVTAALAAVEAHGGKIVAPRFVVPGVVILGLFTDPAGNFLGVVETKDGQPIVP